MNELNNRQPPKSIREMLGNDAYRPESIGYINILRAIDELARCPANDGTIGERTVRLQQQVRNYLQQTQRVPEGRSIIRLIPDDIRSMGGNDGPQAMWNRAVSLRGNCQDLLGEFPSLIEAPKPRQRKSNPSSITSTSAPN